MLLEHHTLGSGHLELEQFAELNTGAGAIYTELTINSRLQRQVMELLPFFRKEETNLAITDLSWLTPTISLGMALWSHAHLE